jgi:hypothetical protein
MFGACEFDGEMIEESKGKRGSIGFVVGVGVVCEGEGDAEIEGVAKFKDHVRMESTVAN